MRSAVLLASCLVFAAPALAQELNQDDKRLIRQFDMNYKRLEGVRRSPSRYRKSDVERNFGFLQQTLDQVSEEGKKTASYEECQAQLDEFKAIMAKAWAPKSKPEPKPTTKPTPKAQPTRTPPKRPQPGATPAGKPKKPIKPYAEPEPKSQPGDLELTPPEKIKAARFSQRLAKHQDAVATPTSENELDLRCLVLELEKIVKEIEEDLHRRGADEEKVLRLRRMNWETGRLRHVLDATLGRVPTIYRVHFRGPTDPVRQIAHELSGLCTWNEENKVALQDPAQAAAARQEIEGLRARQMAVEEKFHRTSEWIWAEYQYRSAMERYRSLTKIAASYAARAGDVDGRLAGFQKLFPRSFDPSFQGPYTPDGVQRWVRQLKNWDENVPAILEFFGHAEKLSIKARSDEFFAYRTWFSRDVKKKIREALAVRKQWGPAKEKFFRQTSIKDMGDADMRKWIARMNAAVEKTRLGAAFDQAYHGEVSPEVRDDLRELIATHERMQREAGSVADRRLPEATYRDAELLAVAKTLIREKYGDTVRGVRFISAPYDYDYEEVTGRTAEVIYYKITWWKSVQISAAEKSDGKWWINDGLSLQRRLNKGGTPIGEWGIYGSGDFTRSIPEANISDD